MEQATTHAYAWSKSWIEFTAPNAQGVYWIRDKEGNTIIIGKGDVRERLLGHWNRTNPAADLAIWDHNPHTFRFELTKHPARPIANWRTTCHKATPCVARPSCGRLQPATGFQPQSGLDGGYAWYHK